MWKGGKNRSKTVLLKLYQNVLFKVTFMDV